MSSDQDNVAPAKLNITRVSSYYSAPYLLDFSFSLTDVEGQPIVVEPYRLESVCMENGEPIRLLVDLENDHDPIGMFVHDPKRELIVASNDGYGFRVSESEIIASTRGGRKTLNVKGDGEAVRVIQTKGNKVATIGDNRKILVFDVDELPVMTRGKGVRLQKYKDGGLADITTFDGEDGLTFLDTSQRRNEVSEWNLLQGKRAQAGRMAPRGFSRKSSFDPSRGL